MLLILNFAVGFWMDYTEKQISVDQRLINGTNVELFIVPLIFISEGLIRVYSIDQFRF